MQKSIKMIMLVMFILLSLVYMSMIDNKLGKLEDKNRYYRVRYIVDTGYEPSKADMKELDTNNDNTIDESDYDYFYERVYQ